jgi:hypothetical protein
VTTGTVIAVDSSGRPALVAHVCGQGKTLLCAYPLESYLAVCPAVFEATENTHLLYRAMAEWAGIRALFSTDATGVEVSGLVGSGRGYAVLANHQPAAAQVAVRSSLPLKEACRITAQGRQSILLDGNGWRMEISAYDGAVVEWQA